MTIISNERLEKIRQLKDSYIVEGKTILDEAQQYIYEHRDSWTPENEQSYQQSISKAKSLIERVEAISEVYDILIN